VLSVYIGMVLAVAGVLGSYVPHAPRVFSRLADLALPTGVVLVGVSLGIVHWVMRRRGERLWARGEFRRGTWTYLRVPLFATFFIMVVVAFATSGGKVDQGGGGIMTYVTGSLAMGVFGLLYLAQMLHGHVSFELASEQTRRVVTGWAGALTAAVIVVLVLLLDVRGGALGGTSFGRALVIALVTAVLLTPFFSSLFRLVWRVGWPAAARSSRWRQTIASVRHDIFMLEALRAVHQESGHQATRVADCPDCTTDLRNRRAKASGNRPSGDDAQAPSLPDPGPEPQHSFSVARA
jgi:hypothetical protein